MAFRRAALNSTYCSIILNPRTSYWKFKPPLIYKRFVTSDRVSGPNSKQFSSKPCYDNSGIVTYACLKKLLSENDIQLFDVRSSEEVKDGKIPGATNIPLDKMQDAFSLSPKEFQKKYNVQKPDFNDENITIHCRSGVRANKAIEILNSLGFKRAHNFTGGWVEWQKAMEDDIAAANK